MAVVAKMAELMNHNVVHNGVRGNDDPPVELDVPAAGATSPLLLKVFIPTDEETTPTTLEYLATLSCSI